MVTPEHLPDEVACLVRLQPGGGAFVWRWNEAAELIISALRKAVARKTVTYDLARQMKDARQLRCSEFGAELVKIIRQV